MWHCVPVWLPAIAKTAAAPVVKPIVTASVAPVKAWAAAGKAVRRVLRHAGATRGGARATWRAITVCTWIGAPLAGGGAVVPHLLPPAWGGGGGGGGWSDTPFRSGAPNYASDYAPKPINIPEPASLAVLALGAAVVVAVRRRRR